MSPLAVTVLFSFVKKPSTEADHIRARPTRHDRPIFRVPSLHVHACLWCACVCLWATAAHGFCAGRTGRDTSEPPPGGPQPTSGTSGLLWGWASAGPARGVRASSRTSSGDHTSTTSRMVDVDLPVVRRGGRSVAPVAPRSLAEMAREACGCVTTDARRSRPSRNVFLLLFSSSAQGPYCGAAVSPCLSK